MWKHLVVPSLLSLLLLACTPPATPTPSVPAQTEPTGVAVALTATAQPTAPAPSPTPTLVPSPTPTATPTPTTRPPVPLSEKALKNAEYTVCGEKVKMKDNSGITNKPGLDHARQCKTRVEHFAFGDIDGDQLDDAVVVLYTRERSHQIPSIHAMVNNGLEPRETTFQELPWEKDVTDLTLAKGEARVTVAGGPNREPAETIRVRLVAP